ncbi:MAG: fibronectin type III domain-containing protein [Treponema sp.]|nr:fibronectin type III domain-containing protein [Treponema sp.]
MNIMNVGIKVIPSRYSIWAILYTLALVSSQLYGIGEKTLVIGGRASWNIVENRMGITEISSIRPYPVLILSSALRSDAEASLDMDLSFDAGDPGRFTDQTGHYRVKTSEGLYAADRHFARIGMGAALFSGNQLKNVNEEAPIVITPQPGALLAPGQIIRDFTIQFWLFPMNLENGEQILSWLASKQDRSGKAAVQRIQCTASKNRLQWTFLDFFYLNAPTGRISISLEGSKPLIPKTWSHHLIRFDADTGLLEYLVNGDIEAITYVTAGGREGGQVYYPRIGQEGTLSLGESFIGMLDELQLYSRFVTNPVIHKYPTQGGRAETRPIDLGEINTRVLMVEVSGGRTSNSGGLIQNEHIEQGGFRFSDDSALQFFIRTADFPYHWNEAASGEVSSGSDWQLLIPGTALSGIRGRFVQIAAVFYPSGDGETSPYLDEIRIHYQPDEPPAPPSRITAIAGDGAVELSWRPSNDVDLAGYLVYYGTSQGDYFGEGAVLGASPINVGNRTSIRIDGLKNGTLYYFAVAAYDQVESTHIGAFSREIAARPLRMLE